MKSTRWFIFVVLAASLMLAACAPALSGSASDESLDNYGYASEGEKASSPQEAPGTTRQDYSAEEQDGTLGGSQPGSTLRMVIMNASLEIVVEDPTASLEVINDMATEMGGYVVSSSLYKTYTRNGDEAPEGTITIRVPSERLTEALDRIKGLVKDGKLDVRNEQVSGQDVTQEYTDMASRLRNLEATEQQLLKIQEAATTTEEIMMVFNQITQVRGEIEIIKGQMKYYEESARLSSVTVKLVAQAKVEPVTVAGWKPEGVAAEALQALVDAGKWLVEQLIWFGLYLLPILLVIGVPAFFIWRAVRNRMRKNAAARSTLPQAYPPQNYPPQPPAQPQG